MALEKLFIDVAELKQELHYDPETGLFTRLSDSPTGRVLAGFVYRTKLWNRYMRINVGGHSYAAHRLAWVYMTGEQPNVIDHVNGIRHDNRFANLRDGTHAENSSNLKRHRKAAGTFIEEPN